MKTNSMNEREHDKRISDALAKGALIWAPVYAVSASTVIWGLTMNSVETIGFSGIFMKSLLVFAPLCIAAGVIRWALVNKRLTLKEIACFKAIPSKLRNKHA